MKEMRDEVLPHSHTKLGINVPFSSRTLECDGQGRGENISRYINAIFSTTQTEL